MLPLLFSNEIIPNEKIPNEMLRFVMLGVITPSTFNANPKFSKKISTLKGFKKLLKKSQKEKSSTVLVSGMSFACFIMIILRTFKCFELRK
jgi:hypothetical protein